MTVFAGTGNFLLFDFNLELTLMLIPVARRTCRVERFVPPAAVTKSACDVAVLPFKLEFGTVMIIFGRLPSVLAVTVGAAFKDHGPAGRFYFELSLMPVRVTGSAKNISIFWKNRSLCPVTFSALKNGVFAF